MTRDQKLGYVADGILFLLCLLAMFARPLVLPCLALIGLGCWGAGA